MRGARVVLESLAVAGVARLGHGGRGGFGLGLHRPGPGGRARWRGATVAAQHRHGAGRPAHS
eukprot:5466553-Lingulodinium_polyedra.AAC.1